MDTQAIAARLTAIAEKCERNSDSLLACGNDYSDVLLDAALVMREASAHVETLTQQVADNGTLRGALAECEREIDATAKRALKAEQQRDAAHAALAEAKDRISRLEGAMNPQDISDAMNAPVEELCDCCERPLGNAIDKCPWCHVKFVAPAQETERGR